MALKSINKPYNPSSLNTWLNGNGGYVQQDLFVWAAITPLGLKFSGFITTASIQSNLNAGNIVILNVHNGGHWVLATSMINSNTVAVNDPGYSTTSYTLNQIVDANCGVYTIGNSLLGMMIEELESILKIKKHNHLTLSSQ